MQQQQAGQQPPLSEQDVPQLLQLLQTALSNDSALRQQTEGMLASLEGRVGFCSCLAAVVGNPQVDHSARWLAAVQLKNSVNKHWRPRYDRGGLSPEEKAYLRGRLLQLIPQEDNQIAVQIALVIAKAARFDFPQQWPSLFNDLLAGLPSSSAAQAPGQPQLPPQQVLLVRRTYFVLHHVLKELSSKRLAADQKAFAQVTELLFEHVWSSWGGLLSDILARLPAALAAPNTATPPALLPAFERWLLLLKILRRLLVFGFSSDAKTLQPVPAVATTAPQLLAAAAALHAARPQQQRAGNGSGGGAMGRSQLLAVLDRGMLKLIKTLSQVQQEHPWSFHHAGVLIPTLEACCGQLLAAAGNGPFNAAAEALLMTCCKALLEVMASRSYSGKVAGGGTPEQVDQAKRMAAEVSAQLTAWWEAPIPLPHLPTLAAALAAAHAADPAAAAAAAAAAVDGSNAQQQQQQHVMPRRAVLLLVVVAGYMPLTLRDLEEWSAEGEVWAHANNDAASNSDTLRSCCHQLLLALVMADVAAAGPVLVTLLKGVTQLVPPGWGFGQLQQQRGAHEQQQQQHQQQQQQVGVPALPGPCVMGPGSVAYPGVLLLKEAVYDATALATHQLHNAVDYRSWLHTHLLPEMMAMQHQQQQQPQQQQQQQQQQMLPLMQRIAARVVGQWHAELKPDDRPAVYAALTVLLLQPQQQQQQQQQQRQQRQAEPDVVLQLSAVAALRDLIDDFGFDSQVFLPVLPAVVGGLTAMLRESSELDTQTQVFGLINLIIDALGEDATPHVQGLLPLLPQIWQEGHDQSLLRIQVLCCLALVVNVLGPHSPSTYALLVPLLREALHPDSNQPELLEDGLGLWLVAVRNAPNAEAGAPLLELTPALTACLTSSTEHIHIGMQLLTSLLLLGGDALLASYGPQLLAACTAYVGEVVDRGLLLMLPPMDMLLVAAPQQSAPLLLPFLERLLGLILSGKESMLVVSNALLLFPRLLLQHQAAFEQLLGNAAASGSATAAAVAAGKLQQQAASTPEGLLTALLGVWCDAFDSIAQPLARKLAACGLAALLAFPVEGTLQQLSPMLTYITSVYRELEATNTDNPATELGEMLYGSSIWSSGRGGGGGGEGFDDYALGMQGIQASEDAEGESHRRAALREAEPLRHIRLSRLLTEKLSAAAAVHGAKLTAAMAAVHPDIQQQVQAMMAAAAGAQQQH